VSCCDGDKVLSVKAFKRLTLKTLSAGSAVAFTTIAALAVGAFAIAIELQLRYKESNDSD
jgi:hypothetical protein